MGPNPSHARVITKMWPAGGSDAYKKVQSIGPSPVLLHRLDLEAIASEWESTEERDFCTAPFTAREALSILEHISDSDCRLLGFDPDVSHPKHMILQVLVVPPPCTRPAIYSQK